MLKKSIAAAVAFGTPVAAMAQSAVETAITAAGTTGEANAGLAGSTVVQVVGVVLAIGLVIFIMKKI